MQGRRDAEQHGVERADVQFAHGGRVVRLEDVTSTEAGADDRLEARRALAAIRALPEAYRETLVLRLVEGMTGPEIAVRTGLTPDSVRVNLCRGMKLLRESLLTATRR